eukprot:8371002-Alexandrium_andersonii.AAC.1
MWPCATTGAPPSSTPPGSWSTSRPWRRRSRATGGGGRRPLARSRPGCWPATFGTSSGMAPSPSA